MHPSGPLLARRVRRGRHLTKPPAQAQWPEQSCDPRAWLGPFLSIEWTQLCSKKRARAASWTSHRACNASRAEAPYTRLCQGPSGVRKAAEPRGLRVEGEARTSRLGRSLETRTSKHTKITNPETLSRQTRPLGAIDPEETEVR